MRKIFVLPFLCTRVCACSKSETALFRILSKLLKRHPIKLEFRKVRSTRRKALGQGRASTKNGRNPFMTASPRVNPGRESERSKHVAISPVQPLSFDWRNEDRRKEFTRLKPGWASFNFTWFRTNWVISKSRALPAQERSQMAFILIPVNSNNNEPCRNSFFHLQEKISLTRIVSKRFTIQR